MGTTTILDVGCSDGRESFLRDVRFLGRITGVEAYIPAAKKALESKAYHKVIVGDISKLWKKFKDNSFDAVVSFDVIEHLDKTQGWELIKQAQRIARRKVIILTPNGYISQDDKHTEINPWNKHRSGWFAKDFNAAGFACIGAGGLKFLRREEGYIRFSPKTIWLVVANVSQFFFSRMPALSFHLLAVKSTL
ncbi:class I SAM-dependent methyltransferase [Patescibacteria group bacterium]|nr:class I SAM-dependent methyltransferase [Patescibacteria group bacterium]